MFNLGHLYHTILPRLKDNHGKGDKQRVRVKDNGIVLRV